MKERNISMLVYVFIQILLDNKGYSLTKSSNHSTSKVPYQLSEASLTLQSLRDWYTGKTPFGKDSMLNIEYIENTEMPTLRAISSHLGDNVQLTHELFRHIHYIKSHKADIVQFHELRVKHSKGIKDNKAPFSESEFNDFLASAASTDSDSIHGLEYEYWKGRSLIELAMGCPNTRYTILELYMKAHPSIHTLDGPNADRVLAGALSHLRGKKESDFLMEEGADSYYIGDFIGSYCIDSFIVGSSGDTVVLSSIAEVADKDSGTRVNLNNVNLNKTHDSYAFNSLSEGIDALADSDNIGVIRDTIVGIDSTLQSSADSLDVSMYNCIQLTEFNNRLVMDGKSRVRFQNDPNTPNACKLQKDMFRLYKGSTELFDGISSEADIHGTYIRFKELHEHIRTERINSNAATKAFERLDEKVMVKLYLSMLRLHSNITELHKRFYLIDLGIVNVRSLPDNEIDFIASGQVEDIEKYYVRRDSCEMFISDIGNSYIASGIKSLDLEQIESLMQVKLSSVVNPSELFSRKAQTPSSTVEVSKQKTTDVVQNSVRNKNDFKDAIQLFGNMVHIFSGIPKDSSISMCLAVIDSYYKITKRLLKLNEIQGESVRGDIIDEFTQADFVKMKNLSKDINLYKVLAESTKGLEVKHGFLKKNPAFPGDLCNKLVTYSTACRRVTGVFRGHQIYPEKTNSAVTEVQNLFYFLKNFGKYLQSVASKVDVLDGYRSCVLDNDKFAYLLEHGEMIFNKEDHAVKIYDSMQGYANVDSEKHINAMIALFEVNCERALRLHFTQIGNSLGITDIVCKSKLKSNADTRNFLQNLKQNVVRVMNTAMSSAIDPRSGILSYDIVDRKDMVIMLRSLHYYPVTALVADPTFTSHLSVAKHHNHDDDDFCIQNGSPYVIQRIEQNTLTIYFVKKGGFLACKTGMTKLLKLDSLYSQR